MTPFHLGVGLLAKGAAPARVSLSSFAVSQVVIDLESAWHLLRGEWPVHSAMHTLLLAIPLGVASGALVWLGARLLDNTLLPLAVGAARGSALQEQALAILLRTGGAALIAVTALMTWGLRPLGPVRDVRPRHQSER